MSYISKRTKLPKITGDILSISSRAKEAKKIDKNTIDGSIGAFLDESGKLVLYTDVENYLKNDSKTNLAYPLCLGGTEYQKAILKFLLRDRYDYFMNKYNVAFSATLGGTSACSTTFSLFLEEGQTVLFPYPCWPNYALLAEYAGVKDAYYNLVKNGSFDYEDLEKQINSLTQDKVLIVINDPAENPTGFSMSDDDLKRLKEVLERCSKPVTILFDIAYLNYGPHDPKYIFEYADSLPSHVLSLFAFSLSKTLSVYGLRGGALIAFFKNEEETRTFNQAMNAMIRGTYSCPNSLAIGVAAKVFNHLDTNVFLQELETYKKLLSKRDIMLVEGLKSAGIKVIESNSSFYVTFYCSNSYELCERLEKKHVFLVPLDKHMTRVAVSGLSQEEIKRLIIILTEEVAL